MRAIVDQRSGTMTTAALEAGASADPPPSQFPQRDEDGPQRSAQPMSRFQLRNWRVRWRIGVLVVIPTVAAIVQIGRAHV